MIRYPADGDILLFRAEKNAAVQLQQAEALLSRNFNLSQIDIAHVAMAIGRTGYIEAVPKVGVRTRPWACLRDTRLSNLTVLRHRDTQMFEPDFFQRSVEAFGAKYNLALNFHDAPILREKFGDARFCSQLVEEIYTRERLGIASKRKYLFPNDFKVLLAREDWEDVTAVYPPYISGHADFSETGFEGHKQIQQMADLQAVVAEETRKVDELVKDMTVFTNQLQALSNEVGDFSRAIDLDLAGKGPGHDKIGREFARRFSKRRFEPPKRP